MEPICFVFKLIIRFLHQKVDIFENKLLHGYNTYPLESKYKVCDKFNIIKK